jgi:hypothetical protein
MCYFQGLELKISKYFGTQLEQANVNQGRKEIAWQLRKKISCLKLNVKSNT